MTMEGVPAAPVSKVHLLHSAVARLDTDSRHCATLLPMCVMSGRVLPTGHRHSVR